MVDQKLDVYREGKWKAVRVLRFDKESGMHALQDVQGGAATEVLAQLIAGAAGWFLAMRHRPAGLKRKSE